MAVIKEDLLPGSPKAQKIVRLIRDHIDMSYRAVSQYFPLWDQLERQYTAYRPIDEGDLDSLEKYGVQKIIIPMQFATVQAVLTFLMEIFTAVKPVLRVRGADPASVKKARVMEVALDYDYRGNKGYFMMQQWFLNACRYGYGIMENTWGTKQTLKRMPALGKSIPYEIDGVSFSAPGAIEYQDTWFTTFEGNKWSIMDNRQWFPDPRLPLSRFQEGSFCARRTTTHDNDLFKMEDQGLFFNTTRIAQGGRYGSTRDADIGSADNNRQRFNPTTAFEIELASAKKNKMHVDEMIEIELIPKDYDLSTEERPQKWLFNLIDGTTIVRAERSPFLQFPYSVCEVFPDTLAFMSQGFMELTNPLASHLDFLFNSHMANVRKAIKDQFVFDPSKVSLEDLLNPEDGKLIRLLPMAYGTDPAMAVRQMQVVDVTRGHSEDAKLILDLWERITGQPSAAFGQAETGRRTALELQGIFRQAGARMKMVADIISATSVAPLTEQMAWLRQQNMSMSQFMEIAGHTAADLGVHPEEIVEGFLALKRDHLDGVFSYPAEEGVLPQDRAGGAEYLDGLLDKISKAPFLAQFFDPVAIVRESVRQRGLHNVDDFMQKGVITGQTQIFSPEMINEYLASKKMVPTGRPNEGITEEGSELSLKGAMNGAGRPQSY